MSTLVPQPDLEELVAKKAIGLSDLLDKLATGDEPGAQQSESTEVPTPPQIRISDEQVVLLRRLAMELSDADLPSAPRLLTEAEKTRFIRLFDELKDAKSAVTNAENAFKEAFANHLDMVASEGRGRVLYDEHGHVLAKGEVLADGVSKKVTRELRGGKALPLSIVDLKKLEDSGEIDHTTFLQMTASVPATRRVDETKIMELLARKPELIKVLATVATLTGKTSSIYVRKA